VERVEEAVGKPPILYATDELLAAYESCLPKRRLWVRAIMRSPHHDWLVWQFANRARVPGIMGPVDLDVFRGDRDAFEQWRNFTRK
jgi:lysozyme